MSFAVQSYRHMCCFFAQVLLLRVVWRRRGNHQSQGWAHTRVAMMEKKCRKSPLGMEFGRAPSLHVLWMMVIAEYVERGQDAVRFDWKMVQLSHSHSAKKMSNKYLLDSVQDCSGSTLHAPCFHAGILVRPHDKLPKKNGEGSWRRDAPNCSEKQMRTPRAAWYHGAGLVPRSKRCRSQLSQLL